LAELEEQIEMVKIVEQIAGSRAPQAAMAGIWDGMEGLL